jgi:uncharacterized protein (DUF1684 family)
LANEQLTMNNRINKIFLFAILILIGCNKPKENQEELAQYTEELKAWDKKRQDILLGPNGWVNVRGLFWLKEGINSFGSGKDNDIVFPENKIAEKAGFMIMKDSTVAILVLPDVKTITSNKSVIRNGVIFHPDSSKAKTLKSGSLEWFVIKRGDKIGVRLRDLESEKLQTFKGIERFNPDLKWRMKAKLAVQPGKTIDMANVLGQTSRNPVKGTLTFTIEGKEYSLDAIDEDGKLFIIFGDETNGELTYGSGRYLYAKVPESGNEVDLDFNHAINPPCAFTEFATCLLPPKQNILPFKVEAGEKAYH